MNIIDINSEPDETLKQTINYLENNWKTLQKIYKKNSKYIDDLKICSYINRLSSNTLQLLNKYSGYLYVDEISTKNKISLRKRFKQSYNETILLIDYIEKCGSLKIKSNKLDPNLIRHLEIVKKTLLERLKQFIYYEKTNRFINIEINSKKCIMNYINQNKNLITLNKNRSRNYILYYNESHAIVYDIIDKKLFIQPNIAFSDIENDRNRKYAENVCINLMYNFDNNKNAYISLLKKHSVKYDYLKQIEILNGSIKSTETDILVLISLLGRLEQINIFGPLSTYVEKKLDPNLIIKNKVSLNYIKQLIYTLEGYRNLLLDKTLPILEIKNIDFNILKHFNDNIKNDKKILLIELFPYQNKSIEITKVKVSTNKHHDNIKNHNYIESFFKKFILFYLFENIPPIININNSDFNDSLHYINRYENNFENRDIFLIGKIIAILNRYIKNENIIEKAICNVVNISQNNTYSKKVASYLLNLNDKAKNLIELLNIYINHVYSDKSVYLNYIYNNINSEYNNKYISIVSDIHLIDLNIFEKSNISKNFNILAGDFVYSAIKCGYGQLENHCDIYGVGVLGNHDIYYEDLYSDLGVEISSGFKKTLDKLQKYFPNIEILNDNIKYIDGYAIIGMTILHDINEGIVSFFGKIGLGHYFKKDDYISRAKSLLDQVDKDIPIIFVTHSPFKEYTSSSDKRLGVPSNYIFKEYPNVKIYIHGHGHSKPYKEIINGVLCISNPINQVSSLSDCSFEYDQLCNILEIRSKNVKF